MAKVIIKRKVQYKEDVVLEVKDAKTKIDFMEAIMQNKEHNAFPLNIKEPEIVYTYEFMDITDDDIIND